MDNKEEIWRSVDGFTNYQVSSFGRVRSRVGNIEKILKPTVDGIVRLYLDKKAHSRRVKLLVAIAFHGYTNGVDKIRQKVKGDNYSRFNVYIQRNGCLFENRIIIAGCRNFKDYVLLESEVSYMLSKMNLADTEIVSGAQRSEEINSSGRKEKYGADYLGEVFARTNNLRIEKFPAQWQNHGTAAGPIRNKKMAKYATHLIAFPSKESRGTRNMIKLAEEHGLKVYIVEV